MGTLLTPPPKLTICLAKILLILDLKKLVFLFNKSNFGIKLPKKRGDNLSYTLSNRYNGADLMLLFKEGIFISH